VQTRTAIQIKKTIIENGVEARDMEGQKAREKRKNLPVLRANNWAHSWLTLPNLKYPLQEVSNNGGLLVNNTTVIK